uniref:F-box domain-containing protein n=1 Tax=Caenorhabditis tropicalis TaxID=1561998 RepID=A0A1I7UIA8_9PELO
MSKFMDNHPTALEALILYDVKKARTADQSYQNFCQMIGEKAISEEVFSKLYEKTIKGKVEILENPNLRLCILSDVIDKKPIDESFKDICEMVGSIDYQDFKFWFYRFSSGNLDLDQKTFNDLPLDVVGIIVKHLDFKSQLRLRRVSHGLRNIVDQTKPSIDKMDYISYYMPCTTLRRGQIFDYGERRHMYCRRNSHEKAFSSIKILFENPRLRLESFDWKDHLEPQDSKELIEFLNSLKQQVQIAHLCMTSTKKEAMIALLKAVKPGTLEKIRVFPNRGHQTVVDQLVETEQWKQAKSVIIAWYLIDISRISHHFHHFESFNVGAKSVTLDNMLNMKKAFSENANFKHCFISTRSKPPSMIIKERLGLTDIYDYFFAYSGRYDIPGSNDYLEFQIDKENVHVYRKSAN